MAADQWFMASSGLCEVSIFSRPLHWRWSSLLDRKLALAAVHKTPSPYLRSVNAIQSVGPKSNRQEAPTQHRRDDTGIQTLLG